MSDFVTHIKLALENTVLCRGGNSAKDSYEYAEKMEKMLKAQLKKELTEIRTAVDAENTELALEKIDKILSKL